VLRFLGILYSFRITSFPLKAQPPGLPPVALNSEKPEWRPRSAAATVRQPVHRQVGKTGVTKIPRQKPASSTAFSMLGAPGKAAVSHAPSSFQF